MNSKYSVFGDWTKVLSSSTMDVGLDCAERAQKERDNGKVVYPSQENIFRALRETSPDKVKIVIIGQDPYHEAGQACGLAFSVNENCAIPKSLNNIFMELHSDIGCDKPKSGDLTKWAQQGVLLLNTVLTVEDGKANSHAGWGWQNFVKEIVAACAELPQPVIFILWGLQAKNFCKDYLNNQNKMICSTHPSPLSASRSTYQLRSFFGSKPFSAANKLLQQENETPVDWTL